MALADYAKERIDLPAAFSDKTTFKEFAVRVGRPARDVIRDALEQGINPGYPLGRDYPGMDDVLLIAVTDRRTTDEIDRLAVDIYTGTVAAIVLGPHSAAEYCL